MRRDGGWWRACQPRSLMPASYLKMKCSSLLQAAMFQVLLRDNDLTGCQPPPAPPKPLPPPKSSHTLESLHGLFLKRWDEGWLYNRSFELRALRGIYSQAAGACSSYWNRSFVCNGTSFSSSAFCSSLFKISSICSQHAPPLQQSLSKYLQQATLKVLEYLFDIGIWLMNGNFLITGSKHSKWLSLWSF